MILRLIAWLVFIAVLAVPIHWAAVAYAPDFIMSRVMSAMARRDLNTIVHADRATSDSRVIVKPSPDLLYSTCVFDVSRRPLKVTTAAPTDTYWSVALYAANTDNFFVLNDTQTKGQPATVIIVGKGQAVPPQTEGAFVVNAPTNKGVVLLRTLVNDEARAGDLDQQRRASKCAPL